MRRWIVAWVAFGSGCSSQTVTLAGHVMAGFQSTDVVAGAHVELRDETFALVSEADADADGLFFVEAPERVTIHMVVSGDGLVSAAFPGSSGDAPGFEIPDGQIFAVTEAEAAQQRVDFAGCPDAEAGDGVLYGTTHLAVQGGYVATPEGAGFAFVEDLEQTEKVQACYLDDEGTAVAPDAEVTGKTGRFAIFGVAGGPWALTQGRRTGDSSSVIGRSTVFVPEGGVVARLPALVPLL